MVFMTFWDTELKLMALLVRPLQIMSKRSQQQKTNNVNLIHRTTIMLRLFKRYTEKPANHWLYGLNICFNLNFFQTIFDVFVLKINMIGSNIQDLLINSHAECVQIL